MTTTKAVRVSLLPDAVQREAFADASRFPTLFCGTWGPFVWFIHPGVPCVVEEALPLVALSDWPPRAPRRLGCQPGIANDRSVGNRQRGRPSEGTSTTPHGGITWPRSGPE
ncbi:hypothetical protein F3K39_42250 [Streptomyces sp. LBUM 1479]|nr:hypothetical protein [Streptomyces sp. LBUM 1483]MBP5934214.1 hypothetical protein [Streptomyces sp. LBUM 1479]